jgi:hypothetical protein
VGWGKIVCGKVLIAGCHYDLFVKLAVAKRYIFLPESFKERDAQSRHL